MSSNRRVVRWLKEPLTEQREARELQEEEEAQRRGVAYGPIRSLTEEEERSQRRPKEDGGYWFFVNGLD